ncbi:Gluconate transporter [Gemmatirosa kalamazoonensis]|uniref:Gluconate transporter n=1 Tax=Gemmatirosa kalamazoonensis TaxID=861299 RepID=W0RGV9_9BACT|nr:SLC13 family permease [Gemmatirosa kalamazoonensis]AHG89662.1 Gluconate transporter [Gemmatirosa kalamazoonensis]
MHPLLILLLGMATVLVAIIAFRVNAFLALIGAAILVSVLAPGDPATKIARVADGFGRTAGSVGVVIALAAVIGAAMTESGAADRIVGGFLNLLGERHDAVALGATAFVLSLPVFFDTVFFLLAPLARSMYARTNRQYLKYLLAMTSSGVATHTLVPPHPGPLGVADALGVDLGLMVLMGVVVALPSAIVGFQFARWRDRTMPIPMRVPIAAHAAPEAQAALPALLPSLLPVVLPVLLIASNTIVDALRTRDAARAALWAAARPVTATIGHPVTALFVSAVIAMWLYARRRRPTRQELAELVERSLMGAGIVILIVAAGGAFGASLQATGIGPVIQGAFARGVSNPGLTVLLLAFVITMVIRAAQGSSTVAMITTAGMLGAMVKGIALPYHTVYIGTAIASGSLMASWMNDAGFWIFSKVGGATEAETFRSWTPLLSIVGLTGLATTLLLARLLPLR